MLVDANVLLYAVDQTSRFHQAALAWLTAQLSGRRQVGLPWSSLIAFLRISTNARIVRDPLQPPEAWEYIERWLREPNTWVPAPTDTHADILGDLIVRYELRARLIRDAHVAALAIEHGLTVCSADTDFARFREIRWENPVSPTR
ncbi:MAG: PIN domain-containing protein [Gammaproteobacteria bacterium]|nr:PIN domain-containing protein [Gammaproteobacteria bacterium]